MGSIPLGLVTKSTETEPMCETKMSLPIRFSEGSKV